MAAGLLAVVAPSAHADTPLDPTYGDGGVGMFVDFTTTPENSSGELFGFGDAVDPHGTTCTSSPGSPLGLA